MKETLDTSKNPKWITIEEACERIAEYPPEFHDRIRAMMEQKNASKGADRTAWERAEQLADVLKKRKTIDERAREWGYLSYRDHYMGVMLWFISGLALAGLFMMILCWGDKL